ncbi:dedicator of cytokinesis protein 1-like isoform X2 [Mytilus californianus]|uniref:dedicator of cytokinesis protein 1-like isoform X2 n=1 Tax=Mytilus californianus TaxID=6549 RepID=UPI002245275B|nr:dedicator of cytokinesis protein 1-like isoform X2 [Mytilus californianus]
MTKWVKFDSKSKHGIAVCNFKVDRVGFLKLFIGDVVLIYEEGDDWYRGQLSKDKTKKGIFPKKFVRLKEIGINKTGSLDLSGRITTLELPLIQEITTVLREWHNIWKQLFVERRPELMAVQDMMQELIDQRRKIMSRKLTAEELRDIQQRIATKIDLGNALLGLDLVVRDELGSVLDPDITSTIQLFRQHEEASERIKSEQDRGIKDRQREKIDKTKDELTSMNWPQTFNIYVMLRNFVCRIGEDADLLMSLYDAKLGKFISENYVVKWGKEGVPKDIDNLNNFKVVFTDLGIKDRQREKVFLVIQVVRVGVMDSNDVHDKKQTKCLRRPFGVAATEITDILQGLKEVNEDMQVFIPFQQPSGEEFMESLIKKVVSAKEINHKGQGLWVSLKIMMGDLKQAREEHPHLVTMATAVSRKMGFPEVIMPGDVRNDIYVTIKQGEFTRGSKTADKNVEVTVLVCNKQGEPLKDVISYGCGNDMTNEYRSLVFYHEDKPKWFETIKIAISTEEEFKGLHLKFLFKHRSSSESKDRSERPFAMSFIKLLNQKNGTTLNDTDHNLLVYKNKNDGSQRHSSVKKQRYSVLFELEKLEKVDKIEKKDDKQAPYLDLPCTRDDLEEQGIHKDSKVPLFSGPFTLSQRDSFQINTFVCSTKLTHNVDILGLLKWQELLNELDPSALRLHLDKLMHVDGEEIVKFLQDLLDSLFRILIENTISDTYDSQVFECLVHIIGLISDRKYHQFRPVLDAYITDTFSFPSAYQKLTTLLREYVDRATEVNQKYLVKAMKSLEYLFKFIVKSRSLFTLLEEGKGKVAFEQTMKHLLHAISGMMLHTSDNTLLAQGSALKYMCSAIKDIAQVFDLVELSRLMVEFINNVPKERLTKQKLKCIDDLVHSDLFKFPECRRILLSMILSHTKSLMEEKKEELEDCILVLSDIMDVMYSKDFGSHEEDIEEIIRMNLRTIIQAAIILERKSKVASSAVLYCRTSCVAVLLSVLRQMTDRHYKMYVEEFSYTIDLRDFLMEILILFRVLVENTVFPSDWVEMIMLQNSIILRALRFFAHTIYEKFSTDFEEQLWSCFFHCAISFLTQRALQLEQFTPSKRTKIISRYKDMRREAGFEIRHMWFHLGQNKQYFIPGLVGPILEMTLIPEQELRKATIPIFFDMMSFEFNEIDSITGKIKGNFSQVENELIMKLDALVEGGCGDEEYKEMIYVILSQLCKGHSAMMESGVNFVNTIKELLQRLLEYRKIIQNEIKEHRMSCIVNLLNFYHDIERQEMYIRYLYKLCDLHLECENYTEAAYTIMLHVNLLQWSDEPLPPMLQCNWHLEAQTQRQLKEMLYYDIVGYFDKGKMWEKGIQLCKELAQLYEQELFDYERLSVILRRQADLYSHIISKLRPDPEYFRVGYFGRGFPSYLQNKVFIYRGKDYERLPDFNARMQTLFPNAELMRSLQPPSEELKESDKEYLQINSVSPVFDLHVRFGEKHVSERIQQYFTKNEVSKFQFSRKMEDSGGDVTSLWLERTFLTTTYEFPGILCWFPVIHVTTYQVSPLENAFDTLDTTNKKINKEVEHHISEPTANVQNLSMLLQGVIDASVNGGISNYKIFYNDDYGDSSEDRKLVRKLKDSTRHQLVLLREALNIFKRKAPEDLRPFSAHLEQKYEEMCVQIKQEYSLKAPDNTSVNTLKRYKSMSAVSLSRVSEAFYSSQSTNESNYATPVIRTPASRTPSVFVKADRSNSISPNKGAKVSNLFKRTSFAASDQSSEGGSSNRNSLEQPIELTEQMDPWKNIPITPRRPLRPDANDRRQTRPGSNQFAPSTLSYLNNAGSNSSLIDNNSDTESSDEPPPLPDKCADSTTTNETPQMPNRQIGHRKSKPIPPLPNEGGSPPPVPKKSSTPNCK